MNCYFGECSRGPTLLRGGADELAERGLTDGEEGGGQELALGGELVAVGLGNLLDDTVGAEQAQLPADRGGKPAGVEGRRCAGGSEEAAEIAVAEAGGGELATGDGGQERDVVRVADAEGTHAATVVLGRARDLVEEKVDIPPSMMSGKRKPPNTTRSKPDKTAVISGR